MTTKLVIGVDPGGTTGLAACYLRRNVWEWMPTAQVENCHTQNGLLNLMDTIRRYLTKVVVASHEVAVVCEKFEFRHNERQRDKIDYTPAEIVGALRYWTLFQGHRLEQSGAAMGKAFWTDAKIKKLELWVPGQRHAMDALKHLLRFRAFELGHTDLFLPFKPPA